MRIYHLIDDETKNKLKAIKPKERHRKKKHNERFSQHDLRELMGTNRQTYKRSNGRVKQK